MQSQVALIRVHTISPGCSANLLRTMVSEASSPWLQYQLPLSSLLQAGDARAAGSKDGGGKAAETTQDKCPPPAPLCRETSL